MQQERLESHGPELGDVLGLRKPASQRVLAWTQGCRALGPGAPDEDPKGRAVLAGTSEALGRARCPLCPHAVLGGRGGRGLGKALEGPSTLGRKQTALFQEEQDRAAGLSAEARDVLSR